MNIKLNQKVIEDRCGKVSLKRGDSFYRANKVTCETYTPDRCEAIVVGKEHFHVVVETDGHGGLHTTCSCPKLASVKKDCQHIAAVLLWISGQQKNGEHSLEEPNLAEGVMRIFTHRPIRSSGHQLHFENRDVLPLTFSCKPVVFNKKYMLSIKMKICKTNVHNIREFLNQVKDGKPSCLSDSFMYDPERHCFQKETDAVIHQLIQVIEDERIYLDGLSESFDLGHDFLLIPPSSWEQLKSLLTKTPDVNLVHNGKTYQGLHLSNAKLPLQFNLSKTKGKGYQLDINGLDEILMLDSYHSVLIDGTIFQLKKEDCQYLSDIKEMLEASGTYQIPLSPNQIPFFMEKVFPGLKRLGEVHLSDINSDQFEKTPLVAKLYLDRIKNRLLASLEFNYGKSVINPSESHDRDSSGLIVRDVEKEAMILKLMEESLFAKTDGGYFMQNEALEYEFLYHRLPRLQDLVQIYATTAVRNRIFKGNSQPRIKVKVQKERTNWLEFKFQLDGIPDEQIREVLSALEEKRKYYRLRNGSLMSLESKEFEYIQQFLNAAPIQNEDLESGFVVPITKGLQLLDSTADQAFSFEQSFREFLDGIYNPDNQTFTVPKSLESVLRDYQKQGYKWMKRLSSFGFGGILADDMGLGKTLQSITFILSELSVIREKKRPVLIVCPSSLTYNWLNELKKFTPGIQAAIVDGNKAKRRHVQKFVMTKDVVIVSYTMLRSDVHWFEKQIFHTVFFDEAQAFKNPVTKTAKAVKKIQADHRFALTGTPVENSLEELWSIFHVVFPELFQGLQEYSQLTRKKITRRIRPFLLRRLKKDVIAELPKKIELMESVELLPDQKKLYAAYLAKLRHDTLKHLDRDTLRKNRIRILAGLTRLRQICCHPALFVQDYKGKSAKFEQLKQLIKEARLAGRRVLIFSQFTKMLELISREFVSEGLLFFYLDGQTPSEERVNLCHRFNQGERDLFLISLKAGGTGLNLTGADTVILYDTWWNPAVESQAADRAHRMGQENVVQVIKLVAHGTIEEKMNELQEKKRHLIEEIIDSKEKTTYSLTEEDIREILML
ncbi:helicase SNF [Terrilactibacillus sp. BCM23-1]|uniref:Helicase SNF n=1 Tax=Terrilactibacillus tamarindi TaxID=2599694 RepID=A0A6N8CRS3_9BACI|nr:DEAD/DEAH box helicase [Terrilactibacillus tamarindi]MTT32370.1 helicase SNF [Terrilactibacillus tamarindi]